MRADDRSRIGMRTERVSFSKRRQLPRFIIEGVRASLAEELRNLEYFVVLAAHRVSEFPKLVLRISQRLSHLSQ